MSAIRTTCPYCGVGCGVLATPRADGSAQIAGDPDHPANFGRLCVKGSALGETLGQHGRLLYPEIDRHRVSWDAALAHVADGFGAIIGRHGPEAVALYVSGQLLTEDYYVANKFVKGWLGTANIDTNSRLCMSSAVAGHKRAFGEDVVPVCYEDLELADLIVLVGANIAWCHPIIAQRIARAKDQRPALKIVVIDPRRTATCEGADQHLAIRPGSDVALFNGLLSWLDQQGSLDSAFIEQHTNHFEEAIRSARLGGGIGEVAGTCGVNQADLQTFFELFAKTTKTVTGFSMGVNQSSSGTDKVNAIINCHLATGRIGRPGMGPFSITGQPNAMGGREVGGLANMLAAHMDLEDPEHRHAVQTFWNSPRIADKPGLKAVDLFHAIEAGRIRAVWIMATNPVVSLPDADQVKRALRKCELVVVSDCIADTDTNAYAQVLLPATGWAEKDGTVTNSERRITRQHAFFPPSGEARPDWQIICGVARRMGFAGFDFNSAAEIFDEHARLSEYRNEGARAFNLAGLVGLGSAGYDAMPPVQWPVPRRSPAEAAAGAVGEARLFATHHFSTPDQRAAFVPTVFREPVNSPDAEFPLILNTGRVRDQWHTMTRTGRSATLAGHVIEPFLEMHADDAGRLGLIDGGLGRVTTRWGGCVARVKTDGGVAPGSVFVPIHWNAQFASDGRVGALVNPVVDPLSGEPEFKHTPARVEPLVAAWYGFALTRRALTVVRADWWTRITGVQFTRYEMAGFSPVADWSSFTSTLFEHVDTTTAIRAECLEFEDRQARVYRAARVVSGRLEACFFAGPSPSLPARRWLGALFAKECLDPEDRSGLLAARAASAGADVGPLVCSCFGVGRNTITDAIRSHGLTRADEVTKRVKAGGNCGSCVPEIRKLLQAMVPPLANPAATGSTEPVNSVS